MAFTSFPVRDQACQRSNMGSSNAGDVIKRRMFRRRQSLDTLERSNSSKYDSCESAVKPFIQAEEEKIGSPMNSVSLGEFEVSLTGLSHHLPCKEASPCRSVGAAEDVDRWSAHSGRSLMNLSRPSRKQGTAVNVLVAEVQRPGGNNLPVNEQKAMFDAWLAGRDGDTQKSPEKLPEAMPIRRPVRRRASISGLNDGRSSRSATSQPQRAPEVIPTRRPIR
jgi:hypothetical protein